MPTSSVAFRSFRTSLVLAAVCASLAPSAAFAQAADAGPSIRGRVLDADGAALADGRVELRAIEEQDEAAAEPLAVAVTDERGRYRLDAPRAGIFRVVASAPGRVPREIRLLPLLESTVLVEARLDEDLGLAVRVTDPAGRPIEGAAAVLQEPPRRRLAFGPDRSAWAVPVRRAITGPDGTARLPRAAGEPSALAVTASGFAPTTLDRIVGTAASVRMQPGRPVAVRVVDAEGNAIAGATLRLAGSGGLLARTDGEGLATVALVGSDPTRVVVADDRAGESRVDLVPRGDGEPRTVRLPASRLVAGRVVDADNRRAIAGAVVWPADAPGRAALTDGTGGFVLAVPLGRTVEIRAGASGYRSPRPWPLTVADDGRPGPAIALAPGATVEGRVVGDDGVPIASAALSIEPKPTGGGMMRIEIGTGATVGPAGVTDDDGNFRVGPLDPDAPWVLRAEAEGRAPGTVDLVGLEPRRTRSGVRIVLPRGGALVGTVADGDGAPIPGAEVAVEPAPAGGAGAIRMIGPGSEGTSREVATDDSGRFRAEGLPAGTYRVTVRRSGFASATVEGIEVAARGEPADAGEIRLRPGASVQGRVVDETGAAIEAVEVGVRESSGPTMMFIVPGGSLDEQAPAAVTGPDGWFVVADLDPQRRVTLNFSRPGYLQHGEAEVEAPSAEPLEITLQPSSTLSGHVLDVEGAPVPGASVVLTRTVTATMGNRKFAAVSRQDATADGDGKFVFEEQKPGTVSLEAAAPGLRTANLDGVEIPRGADRDDVEIRLEPGAVLVGRVTAPDGRPVPGARVAEIRGGGSEPEFAIGPDGAATDGDGYYRLEGLEPGARSIEVTHPSYVRTARDVEVRAGFNTLDVEFEGGQPVRGVVLDPSGSPVPAAWVQLVPAGQRWGGPDTTTDGDGRFEIPGVGDGDYGVRATAEGFGGTPTEDSARVRVEGAPVDDVVVRLAPGTTIAGRIVGLEPERIGAVEIDAYGLDGQGMAGGSASASTGEYRIEGAGPGRWRVEGSLSRDGRTASAEVVVEPGSTESRVDLEFGRGVALRGRATIAGRPFVDAMVSAGGVDVLGSATGRTDRDGRFRLDGLEPGTYRLDLRQWSTGIAHQESVELTSDREIEIELPVARVTGRVRDRADRAPVAGARVRLMRPGDEPDPFGSSPSGISDLEGRFRIENVPDGTWSLVAGRDGYGDDTRTIEVREGREVADLDVLLDATEGLVLKVLTPAGRAPDSVTVAVLDGAGRVVESGPFATGEGGTVRLSRVPAGAWEVVLGAPGTGTIRVRADAPGAPVEVRLPEACTLRVSVTELAGTSVRATARLLDASGVAHRSLDPFGGGGTERAVAGGTVTWTDLPPGTWTLEVRAADGRVWTATATTAPGTVAENVLE